MKKHILLLSTMLLMTSIASGCSKTAPTPSTADTSTAQTSEASVTEAPTTEAPATEAPTTEVPATEVPTTEVPATEVPTTETPATEAQNTAANSLLNKKQLEGFELVKQYGFWDSGVNQQGIPEGTYGISELAFNLKASTLTDCGDHYEIDASFEKVVTVPADMKVGDTVTCTLNELTGETREYKLIDEHTIKEQYEDGDGYEFNYYPQDGESEVALNGWSDDFEWCPFYEGSLYISKEAIFGIDIMNEFHTFTAEDIAGYDDGAWFNEVGFSEDGVVTALVFFGD